MADSKRFLDKKQSNLNMQPKKEFSKAVIKGGKKQNGPGNSKPEDIEEHYRRMNAQIEEKNAFLEKEAADILRMRESMQSSTPSVVDNGVSVDITGHISYDEEEDELFSPCRKSTPIESENSRPNSASSTPKSTGDESKKKRSIMSRLKKRSPSDVKGNTSRMESCMGDTSFTTRDLLPPSASEMSEEAQIRLLKAKVGVMQEELNRLASELTKKDEEYDALNSRFRSSEDERQHLSRMGTTSLTQLEKYKRLAEESKEKMEVQTAELTALKKELDDVQRSQRQQGQTQSMAEVKLNRVLEEIDKVTAELSKVKLEAKESSEEQKSRIEELMADNKKLEKQKNELMAGFRKQLKLIDILKRQKMHIEAAKLLSFTEEEFVKCLDWAN